MRYEFNWTAIFQNSSWRFNDRRIVIVEGRNGSVCRRFQDKTVPTHKAVIAKRIIKFLKTGWIYVGKGMIDRSNLPNCKPDVHASLLECIKATDKDGCAEVTVELHICLIEVLLLLC